MALLIDLDTLRSVSLSIPNNVDISLWDASLFRELVKLSQNSSRIFM